MNWAHRNPYPSSHPQVSHCSPICKHQISNSHSRNGAQMKQLALQEWRQKRGGQRQGTSPERGHSCPWARACPSCCYSHRSTTRWPSPERRKTWPPSPWSHLPSTHWSSWACGFPWAIPPTLVSADSPWRTRIHRTLPVCELIDRNRSSRMSTVEREWGILVSCAVLWSWRCVMDSVAGRVERRHVDHRLRPCGEWQRARHRLRNFSPAPHLFQMPLFSNVPHFQQNHRNTIAGSPLGKRIFIYFEKKRFASQKLNFSIFFF